MDTRYGFRDHASSTGGVIDKLTEMVEMLDRTVAATRRAADLRPLMLDDLGLVPAVVECTKQFHAALRCALHTFSC
jgi:signal transduction histidine kinase